MGPEAFRAAARQALEPFDELFMLEGDDHAIGLVMALAEPAAYRIAPSVLWFPWSSPRERLTAAVKWLNVMRKTRKAVFHADPDDERFMDHIKRYGVIRRVGTDHDYWAPGMRALLYSSNRPKDAD